MRSPCSTPNLISKTSLSDTAGRSTIAPGRCTFLVSPKRAVFLIKHTQYLLSVGNCYQVCIIDTLPSPSLYTFHLCVFQLFREQLIHPQQECVLPLSHNPKIQCNQGRSVQHGPAVKLNVIYTCFNALHYIFPAGTPRSTHFYFFNTYNSRRIRRHFYVLTGN